MLRLHTSALKTALHIVCATNDPRYKKTPRTWEIIHCFSHFTNILLTTASTAVLAKLQEYARYVRSGGLIIQTVIRWQTTHRHWQPVWLTYWLTTQSPVQCSVNDNMPIVTSTAVSDLLCRIMDFSISQSGPCLIIHRHARARAQLVTQQRTALHQQQVYPLPSPSPRPPHRHTIASE